MNIITNKEVFSEENQAQTPKKVERRNRAPRKPSSRPSGPRPAPATAASAPATEPAAQSAAPEPKKTVFYQASRPRTPEANPTATPVASSTEQAPTGERSQQELPPRRPLRPGRPNFHNNRSGGGAQPLRGEQPRGDRPSGDRPAGDRSRFNQPGRFQTASRRPDRGRMPQDNAGVFMHPNGVQQPLGQTVQPAGVPRNTSNEKLKIIPLGGLEEIGKNMTVLEYGNDIMIIDMGFMFPDSDMPGVDYIIPDVTYLEGKKQNIRGAIITHGHLDHTGAIPYLVQKLGFPTMYGTAITMGMVKGRLEEFGLVGRNKLLTIEPGKEVIQMGVFRITTFHLLHSIPGAIGLEIETPNGRIAYCTDWKFDYQPAGGQKVDYQELAAIGARGVDLLFSDSTNAEKPGHSISEKQVEASLAGAIEAATGRVIIAMFSSNLNRIQQTMNVAAKNDRKVLVVGRSMQQNVEMAINLKAMNIPPHTLISEREASRFDDNKLLVLSTGAQGEDRSALTRMASGEHRIIKIKKGDTVIISASPIPGNERSVSGLMDVLYKAGAQVVYNKVLDIHTSGHGYQEDLKLMLALMKPQYFVPLHGERSKLMIHGKLAEEVGVNPENVIIGDNGLILEMDNTGRVVPTDNHVPAGYVMVDGLGVGDVGNIVIRDRQAMAQEGIFLIVSVYDSKSKRFLNSPDIISRGFIYMRENEGFVNDVRNEIKAFLQKATSGSSKTDIGAVRNDLRDMVSKMLYEKTERQPMVIPVIIEV